MSNVAELLIEIGADTSDAERGLDSVNDKVGKSDSFFSKAAGGVLGFTKNLLKFGGIATSIMGLPVIGGGLMASWNQVSGVEQATVAMRAYADNAEDVDAVLGSLLDYARSDQGVLFNRTELFGAAQSMLMYGASIEDVAGYTEILSRSVGLGLSDWNQLNTVIGRVGSTGRLTGNDFDYLRAAGFQLDDSLRNTNMTWEELMTHLDAGIPADVMAGQADTIRGKMIRLQSAFRNVGNAILGVDSETSKFIEGGLGWMLVQGIDKARAALNAIVPIFGLVAGAIASAFMKIGEVVGPTFDFIINVLGKFGDYVGTYGAFTSIFYALANALDETFGAGTGNKVITFYTNLKTWTEVAKGVLSQLWDAVSSGVSTLMSFGTSVASLVGTIVEFVRGSDNAKLAIESLAVGLGVAFVAFKAFQGVQALIGVFNAVRTAVLGLNLALLANPAVLIGAAIVGLAAAAYFAYQKFEPFRKIVDRVGSALKDLGKWLGGQISKGFNKLVDAAKPLASLLGGALMSGARSVMSALQTLGSIVGGAVVSGFHSLRSAAQTTWSFISNVFGDAIIGIFNNIKNTIQDVITPFQTLGDAIQSAFSGDWGAMFDSLKQAASEAITAVISVMTLGIQNVITFFSSVDWGALWQGLTTAASAAWDAIVSFFTGVDWSAIWAGLRSAASTAWNALTSVVSGAWEGVRNFFSGIDWGALWNSMKVAARIAWHSLTEAVSSAWNLVKEYLSGINWGAIWTNMKDAAKTAWNTLKDWASAGWQGVRTFFSGINWGSIWNSMKVAASVAWHGLKDIVSKAWTTAKTTVEGIWQGFIDWLDGHIQTAQGWISTLIEAVNEIPGIDIPNPFKEVEEGADSATESTRALNAEMERTLAIQGLGKSAGSVAYNFGSMLGGDWFPTKDGGIKESDTGTTALPVPEAQPDEPTPIATPSSSSGLGGLIADLRSARSELGEFNATQIVTGNQAPISFGAIGTSGGSNLSSLNSHVGTTSTNMRTAWIGSLDQMASTSGMRFSTINSQATSNTNAAKGSVASNAAAMNSSLGSQLGAMAASARTQMAAAYGSVNSQMTAANSTTTAQTTAMALVTRVQMALAAANAQTQMATMASNVKSGAATAASNLSGEAARWAAIILSAGSGAISAARSVGLNIGSSLASGMLAALGSVTSAANALIGQVDRAMRAKAQIASPSKMTTAIGEFIGEGLIVGMEDSLSDVSRAGMKLSNAAIHNPQGRGTLSGSNHNGVPHNSGAGITVQNLNVTIPVDNVEGLKTAVDFVKSIDLEYQLKTA